jgi:uncharacterized protein YecE (DUF72 family)
MGFSYKDWDEVFYPKGSHMDQYLAYYSRVFNSVEIDSTFYGIPRRSTIARWNQATPVGFRFCLKLPRVITHESGLRNVYGMVQDFLESARELGGKLGVILIQFPPSFTSDQFSLLTDFCSALPQDIPFAVEFRDQSWYTASLQTASMLSDKNMCWAATEYPGLPVIISRTSSFIYIRWIGQHGTFKQHSSERIDRSKQLDRWINEIQSKCDPDAKVFGFFNNDYAGFAVGSAIRFCSMINLKLVIPKQPVQGRLL